MNGRLGVVLESRPDANQQIDRAAAEQLIEALVGNLVGQPGIDLVLVAPLTEIHSDSTDQLTLSAIAAGTVVMTWTSPAQAADSLVRLGVPVLRHPHAGDPDAKMPGRHRGPDMMKPIYAFNLHHAASVSQLFEDLIRLREVRSVKTFTLGGVRLPSGSRPLPLVGPAQAPSGETDRQPSSGNAADHAIRTSDDPDKLSQHGPAVPLSRRAESEQVGTGVRSDEDSRLDDLIDGLDEFDQ